MVYPIEKLSAECIAEAVCGKIIYGNNSYVTSVTTDSRTVDENSLYIPIKGENFDGHTFIDDVCKIPGVGYLCSDGHINTGAAFVIEVEDTRKAMLSLASYYRDLFDIKLVGLTGSVGKTTTKEFLASVISGGFSTLSTKGNFNNDIGVPLTLFGLRSEHEVAVIEMGMSNFGEIEVLSKCAKPDIAIITNIGTSHIEFLKSREGILSAKSEIFTGMKKGGKVILNGDDKYLWTLKDREDLEITYVGIENTDCDYIAYNIEADENGCTFEVGDEKYCICIAGVHNVYNALTAIAAGKMLGMNYETIAGGLKAYKSDGIRQNIISKNGYKIINDCYNSSVQSVIAELSVLENIDAKRRIAVLGDMAELGEMTQKLHRDVGKAINTKKIDVLITAGESARYIADETHTESYSFDSALQAAEFLKGFINKDDAVLIKASRCMKFEQIAEKLFD